MAESLQYLDLYQLAEELQQLKTARLQSVFNPLTNRFALEFWQPGQMRLIYIDLTPARPFIVSTPYTKNKKPTKKTPILNFLNAHFVDTRLEKIEVAQKPDRILLLSFSKGAWLLLKCYPHGQHLILGYEDKVVNFPLRPKTPPPPTFVEPEMTPGWSAHELWAEKMGLNASSTAKIEGEPYHAKLIKKLEKALGSLKEGALAQAPLDQERIQVLEKSLRTQGPESQKMYDEIRRLKKKAEVNLKRQSEIQEQIEKLKSDPFQGPSERIQKNAPKKKTVAFSGTKVPISDKWELWVGRTAWQNDDLLRLGQSHDLWLHLRDYAGAHGLLRGPKKAEPTMAQIEFSARVVAILSQSKKKPFVDGEKLDFIVTPKKFVKKKKGDLPGRVIVERETVRRFAFKNIKFEVLGT